MNKWRIEIAELSSSSVLNRISVEASNWINALRLGRQSLGDTAEVPQGASCTILPSGIVTILDPASRRKFTLTKENEIVPQKVISVAPPPISEPARKSDAPIIAPTLTRKSQHPNAKSAAVRKSQPPTAASDLARKSDSVQPTGKKRASNRPPAGTRDSVIESLRRAAFSNKKDKQKRKQEEVGAPAKPNAAAEKPDVVGQEPPKRKPVMQKTVSYVLDPELRKQIKSVVVGNKGVREKEQPPPESKTTAEPKHIASAEIRADRCEQPVESLPLTTVPSQETRSAPDSIEETHTAAKNQSKPSTADSKSAAIGSYGFELLLERNEEPNHENPLTYRERCFVIPKGISLPEIETAMREQVTILQDELRETPKGKFVNLAAFDHRWSVQPDRPPVAIMQWKDWRGDPQIEFPVNNKPANSQALATADRSYSLENAFEALHELQFLNTAAEGLDFVMKLLQEAIPTEASSACLYDINTHELRFVVVCGPAADQRKGGAVPLTSGLFGHAARNYDSPTIVKDVSANPFFDPEIDSRPDLEANNIMYRPLALNEQLLGMIQLINRAHQSEFSEQDENLIDYIAVQLSQFIHASRMKLEKEH